MTIFHPRSAWISPETGELIDHHHLMNQLCVRQVVLLGERHDIAEIHRWQMHVIAALYSLRKNIMVGFEMFPKRLQPVLDEWVDGKLSTEKFIEKSEWYEVWGFSPEIYLPIFHFCRQNNIRMLALNCYRALVKRVGEGGWESVPEEERDGLTPAAPATERYLQTLAGYMGQSGIPKIPTERFVRAQQTWDRAFACNISYAIKDAENKNIEAPLVVGIIGRGHMEYKSGMVDQLRDLGIDDVAVLLTTDQDSHDDEQIKGIADAICHIDMPEPKAERVKARKA